MSPVPQKINRVRQELRRAGISSLGLSRFASKYLPFILGDHEHIRGAVYGRYPEKEGSLHFAEGMLVATDTRVIFLDRRPEFEAMDELSYDVISGVKKSFAWPLSSVTLQTRIGNYTLKFANPWSIGTFIRYIEQRRMASAR